MSTVDLIAVSVVALWLLATLAYQFGPARAAMGRFDTLKILPRWSFFAPHPTMRDSHIIVRDLMVDGSIGPWRPISVFPTRSLLHVIWNPATRPRKILSDACQSVRLMQRQTVSKGVLQCSLPYLLILHHAIASVAGAPNAIARQFAIVDTSGREGRRIWITSISEFHRL